MFLIPNKEKNIKQFNDSDLKGNIFITKNINFDDSGYATLSSGPWLYQSADADFDDIASMFMTETGVSFCSDDYFDVTTIEPMMDVSNRTTSEGAPTPGIESDGIYFNGEDVVSNDSQVERYNGGTWTAILTGLTSSVPTCMASFEGKAGLVIGNANKAYLINTSWATA